MEVRTVLTGPASIPLDSMVPIQADMPRPAGLAADIHRTVYDMPYIRAKDGHGLGHGTSYAYVRDNACLLTREIITARGGWACYSDSKGKSSAELGNLLSNTLYAWFNRPEVLQAF